ncbi:MAG: pitrilysin family protein [Armatimonas sp.]
MTLSLIALAALIIQPPAPAPKKPEKPSSSIVRQTLRSGMRLIVAERPNARLCTLDLRVRVGVGDEIERTNGMAHAVEHMVFKGSADRQPGKIDNAVETLGGELSARTTRDATQFTTTVPAVAWQGALTELSELTLKAAFRAEDWAAERPVIESERALLNTDPVRTGIGALAGAIWDKGEPYSLPLLGTPDRLRGYSADDLRLFWRKHYLPSHMTLAIAGPVKADEVARAVEALFAAEPEAPMERELRRAVPREGALALTATGGIVDAPTNTLVLGWPTPPAADAHSQAVLLLLAELLAPAPDAGRLAGPLVRARPIARSITAEIQLQRSGGMFVLTAIAPKKGAEVLEEELRSQLKRISEDGFSEDEVIVAQAAVRARLLAEEGSVETLAARLALYDSLDAADSADAIVQRLSMVTATELTRAIRLFLKEEGRTRVLVGGQ